MNISEFTEANGWTEFSVGVSNCQRKYAKQFPTKYQCQCNTRSTIQVVEIGGYYVLYPDGYESYSPAHAFEFCWLSV